MKKLMYIVLCILSFIAGYKAQSQDTIPDNLGKDFWLVFPPNYHNERSGSFINLYRDSLFVLITVSKPTNVYIERMNRNGMLKIDTVFISQINTVKSFSYPWFQYELIGFNDSGNDEKSLRQDETVSKQYFRISSDEDIGVYAFNNAQTTTDATLVLPTDALSNAYRIAAYNSHRLTEQPNPRNTSTPSQTAVLAVLDSTYITISPSVETMRGKTKPFTVMLNRGESYLVQANESNDFFSDLSGTNILSSKKIAVFSGHQRALIPLSLGNTGSRDYLFEQLPGIGFWGKSAVVVPFNNDSIPEYSNRRDTEKDLYRIFAHYDSTEIYVDGQFVKRIESGQFYEAPLLKASFITSNKAIMAMAYKSTSNITQSVDIIGDPFMALMPPTVQFLTRYTFLCPTTTRSSRGNLIPTYPIHYLNIIVPDNSLDSVYLDKILLPRTTFIPIPNSGFSYAILKIKEGVHTLQSNQAIGGFVYGYGNAISYGYGLGLRFKKIDNNEPVVSGKRDCYEYNALIYDTLFADSYIDKIFCPDSTNTNIKITNQFGLTTQKGGFTASLINNFLDGSCFVIAEDSIQQQARKRVVIPGFTVSVQNNRENTFTTMQKTLRTNKRYCFPVMIENYGNFTQTITSLKFKNSESGFSLSETLPIILKPMDKKVLTVCFYNNKDTVWNDTLVLGNECMARDVQAFNFKAITDKVAPQSIVSSDDCLRNWEVVLTEIKENDIGIYDITIPDSTLINCTASVQISDSSLARVSVSVIDEFNDAEFTIIAKDSSDNISTIRRTIPGYTIQFTGKSMESKEVWNFGNVPIDKLQCDSVLLYNFGKFTIDLKQFSVMNNVYFSIPPSQFPIIIPPGDSVPIIICYEPKYVQNTLDKDGITLPFKCVDKMLDITGKAVQLSTLQAIQCDIPLKISAIGDKQPIIKELYPQPATNDIIIEIESYSVSQLQFSLIDNTGVTIRFFNTLNIDKGLYSIQLPLNNIANGVYYLRMNDGLQTETKTITIMN